MPIVDTQNADARIVDLLGGPSEVAKLCRIRPQAVSQWKRYGIPDARKDFLRLLRPDVFCASPIPQEARDAA